MGQAPATCTAASPVAAPSSRGVAGRARSTGAYRSCPSPAATDWTGHGHDRRRGGSGVRRNCHLEPDRFDITRQQSRHLTFGSGAHYCPGASLIRMEVEESVRALLSLPRWELAEETLSYAGSNLQDRGPSSLRVRFPAACSGRARPIGRRAAGR
ncbi:putative cytochrome P450 [Sorangium cellulosum So ce56]|uniref:Cytochrome P450 n=1 Tax=Sorangium cellulosum (strain So ce56) TaxID=448385 RepID=A9GPS4_SORC5|nr:putative cytochrome P450 [Sorangium cellulosum So ce56]